MNKQVGLFIIGFLVFAFAFLYTSPSQSILTVQQGSHVILPSSFVTEIGTGVVCGETSVVVNSVSQTFAIGAGATSPPGCACKADGDCSLGKCGCTINKGGSVCCSRGNGSPCLGNGECASGVCNANTGTCDNTPAGTPKLSNGSKCRSDQECTSGTCAPAVRNGKTVNICQ